MNIDDFSMTDTNNDPHGKLRIDSIKITWESDTDEKAEYLGRYSNTPGPGSVDRKKRHRWAVGQYQYWIPGNWDPKHPKDRDQDFMRHESLNLGQWEYQCCRAVASVSYPTFGGSRRLQIFKSSGLWGVESDSDLVYKMEIQCEQLTELRDHLKVFGVPWDPVGRDYHDSMESKLKEIQEAIKPGRKKKK